MKFVFLIILCLTLTFSNALFRKSTNNALNTSSFLQAEETEIIDKDTEKMLEDLETPDDFDITNDETAGENNQARDIEDKLESELNQPQQDSFNIGTNSESYTI
jgi:hypothetical protein